jgi:hypothetical protein
MKLNYQLMNDKMGQVQKQNDGNNNNIGGEKINLTGKS